MQATTHLNSSVPSVLKGKTEPRLFTKPLRPLTPETTKGFELIRFARDVLKEPFDPWQEWLAIHGLELNEDGTYRFNVILVLVARRNGKTHFQKALTLWKMYMGEVKSVLGVAQDLSLALASMRECIDMIEANEWLAPEFAGESRNNGREHFLLRNKVKYFVKAATGKAARGYGADHIVWDEIRTQENTLAWAAISKTINAQPNPQLWAISNAGDMRSVVLNKLRGAALGEADEDTEDLGIALFEWSAKDGCDVTDREAWAQANPALGYRIKEKALRRDLMTDPVAVFRTEVLCQRVDALDAAVDMVAWTDSADPDMHLTDLKERYACVDVSLDGQHVTLAVAAKDPQGLIRVQVAGSWQATKNRHGKTVTAVENARLALPGWIAKVKPVAFGWFSNSPTAALAPDLRALDGVELKGQAVTEACMSFAAQVQAHRIKHNGDALLANHLEGSTKLPRGDGWCFTRRGFAGQVDAAYAAAGAVHLLHSVKKDSPFSWDIF